MDPVTGGSIGLSPAAVGGARRKLKLVTRKKARKMLKKLGLKMRGGADAGPADGVVGVPEALADKTGGADVTGAPTVDASAVSAGRRVGKKTKKSKRSASRRRSSIFGL